MTTISKQLMGGSTAPILKLEITPQKYNIEDNQTPIYYAFKIERQSKIESNVNKNYTLKIGDKVISSQTLIGGVGTKTITSGTVFIEHNADGTKIINCSFSMGVDITWSGVFNGTVSNSANVKLETIPRATQPTAPSSANLGDSITIELPRATSVFTHNLKGAIGDYSFNIANGVGVSYKWAIPLSLANYIESTKAKCKISCTTYSIDDKVGTKSVDIAVNVPSNVIPTIGAITMLETNKKVPSGKIVQNQSLLDVSIVASGVYGSEIVNVISKCDGITYKGTSFKLPINKSGNLSIYTSVIDSRGRKANKTTTISVTPYDKPRISLFKVVRCDSLGTEKHDGECVKISFNYGINEVGNTNAKSVKIEYGDDTYTTLYTYDSYAMLDTVISKPIFSTNKSYKFRMTINDTFSSVSAYDYIGTAITTFDIHSSGQGMAFGKVAEKPNLLDIAWDIKFKNDTEWIPLMLTDFKEYDISTKPEYRVKGSTVEIRGTISPLMAHTSSATRETFARIPQDIAPSKAIYRVCQGSGKATWLFTIQEDGQLQFSRYGVSNYENVPTTAWLVFDEVYTI